MRESCVSHQVSLWDKVSPTCIKARGETPSLLGDTLQNAFPLFLNRPLSGLVWKLTGSDSGQALDGNCHVFKDIHQHCLRIIKSSTWYIPDQTSLGVGATSVTDAEDFNHCCRSETAKQISNGIFCVAQSIAYWNQNRKTVELCRT